MAQTIDTRPQIVDILHYAGDTLTLRVDTSDNYSDSTWSGEIRLDHADATPDASWSFVPDDGGAVATVSDADTTALGELGVEVTEDGKTFKRYTGIYDIQVETIDGIVKTLFRGSIQIDYDVTRP